jgi:hypothetical protein
MFENGKMKLFQEWGGMKSDGGSEFNYDIL